MVIVAEARRATELINELIRVPAQPNGCHVSRSLFVSVLDGAQARAVARGCQFLPAPEGPPSEGKRAWLRQCASNVRLHLKAQLPAPLIDELVADAVNRDQTLRELRPGEPRQQVNYYDELRAYEISLIRHALRMSGGRQNQAAKLLGLRSTTLNQIIKRYGIE